MMNESSGHDDTWNLHTHSKRLSRGQWTVDSGAAYLVSTYDSIGFLELDLACPYLLRSKRSDPRPLYPQPFNVDPLGRPYFFVDILYRLLYADKDVHT